MMDVLEANTLARELIDAHGLQSWSFKLNRNKRQLGVCKEYLKRIELSEHYVARNSREMVLDTILHEIAHALVGTVHGHNHVWKAMCLRLGCNPKACDKDVDMPDGDWRAQCNSCKKEFSRHKRPMKSRGYYCTACGPVRGTLKYANLKLVYQKRIVKASQNETVQWMLKFF
ncbi:MAG TPA: SprT-like domain-containing protein [Chroococcales cyanobacterium]